ncbi:MAG: FG-GAP-like repeat-containing protein, partial [Saprospiraceae bacterium]
KAIGSQITVFANNQKYFQEIHPMRGFESCVDPRPLFGLGNLVEVDSIKIVWPDGKVQKLSKTTVNKTIKLNQPLEGVPFVQDFTAKPLLSEQRIPGLEFVHTENTFNDFERDRLLFNMISKEGPAMAVADINGDHLEDVFIGNAMNSASAFFVQIPGGRFIRKKNVDFISDKGSEDTDAVFFDADGDGDQDLYVCSGGNEVPTGSSLLADRLYFNDGKGNFTKSSQILPTFQFESTSCVRPSDIDGDGDIDLFVGVRLVPFNYGVPCNGYILQNDGKGNFKNLDIPVLKKIGMITDARWADIDNDKKDELIVCGEWMPLMIFKNENGVWKNIAHQWGVDSCNGLWQCIQISDIDNDGDIDLIGGNWGLNSRIKPSPLKPTKMYINDFDQNGTAEQILTTYNGDRSYPLTLRQDLVTQLPYLKKKYLEFKNYKNQTINEIFTPDQVNSSIVLTCNTNAHEIFINKNGKFELLTLPKEAQLSPVFSIIIKDINLDGRKDILLGGGFSAVKPELGSYMAKPISLLIQDTEGKFHDSPLNEIYTEVRQFSTIVVNKSGYILSANNNDSLRIWR